MERGARRGAAAPRRVADQRYRADPRRRQPDAGRGRRVRRRRPGRGDQAGREALRLLRRRSRRPRHRRAAGRRTTGQSHPHRLERDDAVGGGTRLYALHHPQRRRHGTGRRRRASRSRGLDADQRREAGRVVGNGASLPHHRGAGVDGDADRRRDAADRLAGRRLGHLGRPDRAHPARPQRRRRRRAAAARGGGKGARAGRGASRDLHPAGRGPADQRGSGARPREPQGAQRQRRREGADRALHAPAVGAGGSPRRAAQGTGRRGGEPRREAAGAVAAGGGARGRRRVEGERT